MWKLDCYWSSIACSLLSFTWQCYSNYWSFVLCLLLSFTWQYFSNGIVQAWVFVLSNYILLSVFLTSDLCLTALWLFFCITVLPALLFVYFLVFYVSGINLVHIFLAMSFLLHHAVLLGLGIRGHSYVLCCVKLLEHVRSTMLHSNVCKKISIRLELVWWILCYSYCLGPIFAT